MRQRFSSSCTLAVVLASLASAPAFGQTTLGEIAGAAQRPTDKSREALVAIFGNVVNDPLSVVGGPDTMLSGIFMIANSVLLVIGTFLVGYRVVRKLTQTAHDGTAFDKEDHVLWGPIRILWGVVSLVPTPSGWSLGQLLMLWGASVMGVGSANLAVDEGISSLNSGISMVMQPVLPSTVNIAQGLFEASLCMHSINRGLSEAINSGALVSDDSFVQRYPTYNGFILRNSSFVCGGSDISQPTAPARSSTNWFSADITVEDLREAHIQALQLMQGAIDAAALKFVEGVAQRQTNPNALLLDAETAIYAAAQKYENHVNSQAATKQGDIANLAAVINTSLAGTGWWTLGSWYQTFAQANTKLSDAVAAKATSFGTSAGGDPVMPNIYVATMAAYRAQQAVSNYTPPIGTTKTGDYSVAAVSSDSSKVIGSFFHAPGQRLINYLVNLNAGSGGLGQVNPLIKMKNIGDYVLGIAEGGLAALTVAKGVSYVANKFGFGGTVAKIADKISALSSILLGIIVVLFVIGGFLSVYLPWVPFIVWFGAALNWLAVIGEAVIGAVVWGFSFLLSASGDGLGEKSTYGWIFLLNVMVRPLLMVCGFFLAGAALIAGGTFLNQALGIGLANMQFDSITGLVTTLFVLAIYASMAANLVHTCFIIVLIVPDHVINWVGSILSTSLGSDDNERMRNFVTVFTGRLDDMTNRLRQTMGGSGSGKPLSGRGFKR